jgi:hypothetical protein
MIRMDCRAAFGIDYPIGSKGQRFQVGLQAPRNHWHHLRNVHANEFSPKGLD